MPPWKRMIRGMVGTGLTFAIGVGALASTVGVVAMLAGELSAVSLLRDVGRLSVVSFLIGVAFSGVLALAARGRTFDRLSLPFVTTLGTGVGFLYFLLISISGARVWTTSVAFSNLAILLLLGGGAAAGTLIVARRAGRALESGDAPRNLAETTTVEPTTTRDGYKQVGAPDLQLQRHREVSEESAPK